MNWVLLPIHYLIEQRYGTDTKGLPGSKVTFEGALSKYLQSFFSHQRCILILCLTIGLYEVAMKIILSFILVLGFLGPRLGLAKTISLKGIQIKLVDKNDTPVRNYPMSFRLIYSRLQLHIACLFTNGPASLHPSPLCSQIGQTEMETRYTNEAGIIDLNKLSYSAIGAREMYVSVGFPGHPFPKCAGFNYFQSQLTNQMVHDSSLRISNTTVAEMRNKKNPTISCILD